jgi:hypothetical protein
LRTLREEVVNPELLRYRRLISWSGHDGKCDHDV